MYDSTIGNRPGVGWRQPDRTSLGFPRVSLLNPDYNPDYNDDDATSRRFALLEIN